MFLKIGAFPSTYARLVSTCLFTVLRHSMAFPQHSIQRMDLWQVCLTLLISEVTLHIVDHYIKHPVKFAAVPLDSV
jgi:hypothetical protein